VSAAPLPTGPVPGLPPAIEPAPSPFWPRHLADLFVRPTRFFASQLALGRTPWVLIVTWASGISAAIDRIDVRLMREELAGREERREALALVVGTWPRMWAFVLGLGVVGGALHWWLGGWWCRVRLRWCGAPAPDRRLARLLFLYSSFVFTGPAVIALAVQTLLYPSYLEAFAEETVLGVVVGAMTFWSLATTYRGALALFPVRQSAARFWFVVLPALFFLLTLGGAAALYAAFAPAG
jgi:hypothetical protein